MTTKRMLTLAMLLWIVTVPDSTRRFPALWQMR